MEKQELINELNAEFGQQFPTPQICSFFNLMWQLLINETHEQPLCLYDVHHDDGYQLGIVKPDEYGYYPTGVLIKKSFKDSKWDSPWDFVYALNNKAFGHDKKTVWEMVSSSMDVEEKDITNDQWEQSPTSLIIEVLERVWKFGNLDSVRDEELIARMEYIEKNRSKFEQPAGEIKLAEQQIIGFMHGRRGGGLMTLIDSMGLKKSEWQELREENLGLNEYEKKKIDNYFEEKTVTGQSAGSHG